MFFPNRKKLSGVRKNLTGVRKVLAGVRKNLTGVRKNLSGVRKVLSGVRKVLSGVRKVPAPDRKLVFGHIKHKLLFKRKKYHPTEQKILNWNNKYLPWILWAFLLMCLIGWLIKII